MDNNGKINRGIDLGTTNSAIAVMTNGKPARLWAESKATTLIKMLQEALNAARSSECKMPMGPCF